MTNILHLVDCLSLGAGPRALIALAKYSKELGEFNHRVASLNPVDPEALKLAEDAGIQVSFHQDRNDLFEDIKQADIVNFSWWNTPDNYDVLRSDLPEMRLLIWFHIGGESAPQILTHKVIERADFAAACSPFIYNNRVFQSLSPEDKINKTAMVYGGADFERLANFKSKQHESFNVGYIGTATRGKVHPDYVSMSSKIDVPNIKFIICGHIEDYFKTQKEESGVSDRFDFRGYEKDIVSIYETLDVFGYPLCEETYAAAELTLQEAMYTGVVPVVFPNGGVKDLVINNFTGYVVNSDLEYRQAIEHLYNNPEEKKRLSENCKNFARQIFGAENAAKNINKIYDKLLQQAKQHKTWDQFNLHSILNQPLSLFDIIEKQNYDEFEGAVNFIESLGDSEESFILSTSLISTDTDSLFEADKKISEFPRIMFSNDTGGIFHYKAFYLRDPYLRLWSGLVLEKNGEYETALSYFQSAINVGFKHWRVYWYIARTAEKAGNIDLAVKNAKIVNQQVPEFKDAIALLKSHNQYKSTNKTKFETACPHCNTILNIKGKGKWNCPSCNNAFDYKQPESHDKDNALTKSNIETKCPHCNTRLDVKGKGRWNCPGCNEEFDYDPSESHDENNLIKKTKIKTACPHCDTKLDIEGKGRWNCPGCDKAFDY